MIVKEVIEKMYNMYGDKINRINISYYADVYDQYTRECLYPDEFIGVASYHDGYLDTSEDPDGWSLDDEVKEWNEYEPYPPDIDKGIYSIHVNLGEF